MQTTKCGKYHAFAKFEDAVTGFRWWRPSLSRDGARKVAIYALVDPRDSTVRYVGKTNNPARRHFQHCQAKKRSGYRLGPWLMELRAYGLQPRMEIVDWVHASSWCDAEVKWISHFSGSGRIYNHHPGGTGKMPPQEKAKRDPGRLKAKKLAKKAVAAFFSKKEPLPPCRLRFECEPE